MPHISIKMYPGRTDEQKARFTEAVLKVALAELGCSERSLSVAIEEIPEADWMGKVYDRDIREKEKFLTKRPGYGDLADQG